MVTRSGATGRSSSGDAGGNVRVWVGVSSALSNDVSGASVCSVKGLQLLVQIVNRFLSTTSRDYSMAKATEQRSPDPVNIRLSTD